MGKLTYVNRKIQGAKLSQVVTRDIIKRIAPNVSYKAALRDPVIDFDISSKSIDDVGLKDISESLIAAVEQQHPGRALILEEVCLKNNSFSALGILSLAQVIKSSSSEIRNLDLSDNLIEIKTSEDALAWQSFLNSFARCTTLRRLDLSGNKLGSRGFEVLSKVWAAEIGVMVCEETGHATICGLQSVPYICLADTGLDDIGSTYLSYILESHRFVHELLPFVAQARPGVQSHQLEAYDEVEGCNGIIWKPNVDIGSLGLKVLELAEVSRKARMDIENEDSVELAQAVQEIDISDFSTTPTERRSRGDSILSTEDSFHITSSHVASDLIRARSRIQLNVLKNDGLKHNNLWISAFRMLRYTRILLYWSDMLVQPAFLANSRNVLANVKGSTLDRVQSRIWPSLPFKTTVPRAAVMSLRLVHLETSKRAALSNSNPNSSLSIKEPITKHTSNSKSSKANYDINGRKLNRSHNFLDHLSMETKQQYSCLYRTSLPAGFSDHVWTIIIGYAGDTESVLSDNQKTSIIRWGTSKESMLRSQGRRGKHQSQQVYKALEEMGCLAYGI